MTKEKANRELEKNKLYLIECGLDGLPCKKVLIESFMAKDDEEHPSIRLIGLYGMGEREKIVYSFLIQQGWDFWYRDYFTAAMDVIEAIRILNDYGKKES